MPKADGTYENSPLGWGKGRPDMAKQDTGKKPTNFLKNPTGASAKTGGRDFTHESADDVDIDEDDVNDASVPSGGKMPFPAKSPVRSTMAAKPYKLTG